MMTALLSVGAWATDDLTLNVGGIGQFDGYGLSNQSGSSFTIANWATAGWTFDTALSQDDYYGVEFTVTASTANARLRIIYDETYTYTENDEEKTANYEQVIDIPSGTSTIVTHFSYSYNIKKIGFREHSGESTNITVTSAVVKAYDSNKDFTLNMAYANNFNNWGTFNVSENTIEVAQWSEGGWPVSLNKDKYCGVDFSFTETTAKITLKIVYADATEQSIEIPAGSTHIAADFIQNANISKIGFRHGDNDNSSNVSITITSAVVKAESTGEVTELSFSNLTTGENTTRDNENNSFTMPCYKWETYWAFSPAISSDDYEKVVITFSEAIPNKSNLAIHAHENSGSDAWNGTQIGTLTGGTNKATAYFSSKPGVNIDQLGFYFGWNDGETATTLKIASVKLVKKLQKVTVTSAGYATCVTKAKTDFSQTDGITAYIASVNGSKVKLTEVTKVPAGTGIILKGAAADYTLQPTTEATDDITGNELKVSDGTVTGDDTIYVLGQNSEGKVGFGLLKSGDVLAAGKAYLTIPNESRSFIDIDDNVTGIQQVKGSKSQVESYYNLNGQRVAQPTKGVYIVNGKKIIIK